MSVATLEKASASPLPVAKPHRTVAIVAMPGSMSTVVLAMFGRHPALWPAPELHLFSARDLGELADLDRAASTRSGINGTFTAGLAACLHSLGLLGKDPLEWGTFDRWRRERRDWTAGQTLEYL